jgi:uncharacterized protein (TIGR03067 family)
MKRLLSFAILALLLSGCVRPGINRYAEFDREPASKSAAGSATDKERIQGLWAFASLEREGAIVTQGRYYEEAKELKWAFQGDMFHNSSPTLQVDGTFNIDPSQRPPTLDTFLRNGDRTMTVRMLYELHDDTLRLCYDMVPGAGRPKAFAALDSMVVLTLRRETSTPNESGKGNSHQVAPEDVKK